MKKYIEVIGDTNDADYISSFKEINEDDLIKIQPLIDSIKSKSKYHNFPNQEHCDKNVHKLYEDIDVDILDFFIENFVPYGEYGIHTIAFINIYEINSVEKVFSRYD